MRADVKAKFLELVRGVVAPAVADCEPLRRVRWWVALSGDGRDVYLQTIDGLRLLLGSAVLRYDVENGRPVLRSSFTMRPEAEILTMLDAHFRGVPGEPRVVVARGA